MSLHVVCVCCFRSRMCQAMCVCTSWPLSTFCWMTAQRMQANVGRWLRTQSFLCLRAVFDGAWVPGFTISRRNPPADLSLPCHWISCLKSRPFEHRLGGVVFRAQVSHSWVLHGLYHCFLWGSFCEVQLVTSGRLKEQRTHMSGHISWIGVDKRIQPLQQKTIATTSSLAGHSFLVNEADDFRCQKFRRQTVVSEHPCFWYGWCQIPSWQYSRACGWCFYLPVDVSTFQSIRHVGRPTTQHPWCFNDSSDRTERLENLWRSTHRGESGPADRYAPGPPGRSAQLLDIVACVFDFF